VTPGTAPIIILGRGHGGTRAIAETLVRSGVHMGRTLRAESFDALPCDPMHRAAKLAGMHVRSAGFLEWDYSALYGPPSREYLDALKAYCRGVYAPGAWGWKLPETLLSFPWLRRFFPDAFYVWWRRDPRDALRESHITDRLTDWGVQASPDRLTSWVYQEEIVRESLKVQGTPARFLEIRFEDFVREQHTTLDRLESFLGFCLYRLRVDASAVGRPNPFPVPTDILERYGYVL